MVFLIDQLLSVINTILSLFFSFTDSLVSTTINAQTGLVDITSLSYNGEAFVRTLANIIREGDYLLRQLDAALLS